MAHDASEDARRLLQAMEELQDRKVGYVMSEDQTLLTLGLAAVCNSGRILMHDAA